MDTCLDVRYETIDPLNKKICFVTTKRVRRSFLWAFVAVCWSDFLYCHDERSRFAIEIFLRSVFVKGVLVQKIAYFLVV